MNNYVLNTLTPADKMPMKTALKIFSFGYQISMIGVTYKMYTTLQEIKDINKQYTAEVAQLMKENMSLRSKK
jgi:cell shape-determining protein MreC